MENFSFLHTADLHLDAGLSGRLGLLEEKKIKLKEKIRTAFANLTVKARELSVSALLISGDLFDQEAVTFDTISFCYHKLGELPIPVYLLPGNHDFYREDSYYNPEWLNSQGIRLPDNLRIFIKPGLSFFDHDEKVKIWGFRLKTEDPRQRVLSEKIPLETDKINLLLFHASLEDKIPEEKKVVLPFKKAELWGQDFNYIALGHYHNLEEFKDPRGKIKAAYPGTPWGWNIREAGEKFLLLGKLENHQLTLEKIKIADFTIHELKIDLSGLTFTEAILEKVSGQIKQAQKSPQDIFYLSLSGRLNRNLGWEELPAKIEQAFEGQVFHLKIDLSQLKPDYEIDKLIASPLNTLEVELVKLFQAEMEKAPEAEKTVYLQAQYYALDALYQKEVKPRWS